MLRINCIRKLFFSKGRRRGREVKKKEKRFLKSQFDGSGKRSILVVFKKRVVVLFFFFLKTNIKNVTAKGCWFGSGCGTVDAASTAAAATSCVAGCIFLARQC